MGLQYPIEIVAGKTVICDSTYNLNLLLQTVLMAFIDTGVFLEGGSFQSVPVDISLETNIDPGLFGDSVILEGCGSDADFIFTRPSCQSGDSLYVTLGVAGAASNGIDYTLLPDSILFLPGETSITLPFTAFEDAIFEGFEDVVITVTTILDNGNILITSGTLWLYDQPNLSLTAQDTSIYCHQNPLTIFAPATGGMPPYTYTWSNSTDTVGMTTVPANVNGTIDYYVSVIDACGSTANDTLTVNVDQTLTVEAILNQNTSSCDNTGIVSSTWSGDSLVSPNLLQFQWFNEDMSDSFDASVWTGLPAGWYTISITDDVCSVSDSVFVDSENPPIAEFSANMINGCDPLTVNFTNTSQNTSNYTWNFGDGSPLVTVGSLAAQSHTFTQNASVLLTAYTSDPACFDTMAIDINIVNCGCTDPEAVNYDPNAVVDDGNCIYPIPSVTAPNVFTPNGDNDNDIFFLTHKNATHIELIILNRWGNIMYEGYNRFNRL